MYNEDNIYTLMEKTKVKLIEDPRNLLTIHKETNIPFYWLRKFKSGDFNNPSVNRVQYLYEFLTGNKIKL